MSSPSRNNGIGILTVLFLLFLALKLTHFIDWSWWWITAPLWALPAVGLLIVLIGACVVAGRAVRRRVRR